MTASLKDRSADMQSTAGRLTIQDLSPLNSICLYTKERQRLVEISLVYSLKVRFKTNGTKNRTHTKVKLKNINPKEQAHTNAEEHQHIPTYKSKNILDTNYKPCGEPSHSFILRFLIFVAVSGSSLLLLFFLPFLFQRSHHLSISP